VNDKIQKYREASKPRFRRVAQFLDPMEYRNILDIGSYEGTIAKLLRDKYPQAHIWLSDLQIPKACVALDENISYVKIQDLNAHKLPFNEASFDLITCLEVIEHLQSPDNLLAEMHRVLKPKGVAILCTPNLASWVNRFLLLFGHFPRGLSLAIKSELLGRSDLFRMPPRASWEEALSNYHVRCYTPKALSSILKLYGFEVLEIKGIYSYESPVFNPLLRGLHLLAERFFGGMAQNILIRARAREK